MAQQLINIALVFVLILSACNNSTDRRGFGEGRNIDPEEIAKQRAERVSEALGLSDDQTEELTEMYIEFGSRQRELRGEHGGDREILRERMQELNAGQEARMKEILSDEQWARWEEFREDFRQRRPGGRQRN